MENVRPSKVCTRSRIYNAFQEEKSSLRQTLRARTSLGREPRDRFLLVHRLGRRTVVLLAYASREPEGTMGVTYECKRNDSIHAQ